MADDKILLAINDYQLEKLLKGNILNHKGYEITSIQEGESVQSFLNTQQYSILFLEDPGESENVLDFVQQIKKENPALSVLLISQSEDGGFLRGAIRSGVFDLLTQPVDPDQVIKAVQAGIDSRKNLDKWVRKQTRRNTGVLRRHVDELKELEKIGRSVTASLDLDHVLTVIVDAAVKLSDAEEGNILTLDKESGELYVRAARNFQDEFVRTFRLPIKDSLAGDVVRTGVPVIINKDTPQRIKTQYLVRSLMYVPIKIKGTVMGVLGVDNRESSKGFTEQHLSLVSTLADYAAIAIENARLFRYSEVERQKLDSILNQIEDGVIVAGSDNRIVLVNRTARIFFDLGDENLVGEPMDEVFRHEAIIELFTTIHDEMPIRREIALEDGYILNTQLVRIPDVGLAVTMQDITNFKELDRIKTEFVNTVSHDLRSPLTAILGYVELITRFGEVNAQQREFIDRIQISVRNITELINDLLELGRIEAGFDTHKEFVPLEIIVQYAVDSVRSQLAERQHHLTLDVSENLPDVFGDPARLRQVVDIMLSNALQYTPNHGQITVRLMSQRNQLILQVEDNGLGIPSPDQPYIFDKFYRANNVPFDINGSGLGLAIVKSIVENHQGRVWVDSTLGVGSCFTVVLPVSERDRMVL